jgi:AraC-like DNA-binding protein
VSAIVDTSTTDGCAIRVDVLSDVLQQVRLTGAVLFRARLGAPWCIAARPETAVAAQLAVSASQLISFHIVLEGAFWARLDPAAPVCVAPGEVLIVPHGHAYTIGDSPHGVGIPAAQLFGDTPMATVRDVAWGGTGPATRVLCGYLACERSAFAPLFAALPSLFAVNLLGSSTLPSLAAMLDYTELEVVSARQGAAGLRLRMAELMFVEALRRYMEALPDADSGWLAGLRDPLVGRALVLLHQAPERDWSVESLAHEIAASRSLLAGRFKAVLGEPPMQYLTRWRLLLAARRLRDSRASVAAVAEAVGYESPAAFQRAFKRELGATPAQWRRAPLTH